jgi:peptide deformylase
MGAGRSGVLLEIVQVGDPVLRRRALPLAPEDIVKPFVQELITSMRETMRRASGVGLAAPQVDESLQVVVIEDRPEVLATMSEARLVQLGRREIPFQVLVNPSLEVLGEDTDEFFEGCLSVTGFQALVQRWREVRVRALNERGQPVEIHVSGWPARILQHEVDHLTGRLYVDRMDPRSFTTTANLGRFWKARPAGEIRMSVSRGGDDDLPGSSA